MDDKWTAAAAGHRDASTSRPVLSVILPYYRKLDEFQRVLPCNAAKLAHPDYEVVLVLDEPSQEAEVLALVQAHSEVQWRVIVNDHCHDHRPPCAAINVGLRHAQGQFILIASPESAFVGNVPAYAVEVLQAFTGCVALGTVRFVHWSEFQEVLGHFESSVGPDPSFQALYGSIAARRDDVLAIGGYDENIEGWGGDDDNIRIRLELAGCRLLACPQMRMLHVSREDTGREPRRPPVPPVSDAKRVILSPTAAHANVGNDWGRDFRRIAYDWLKQPAARSAQGLQRQSSGLSVHRTVPVRSRRRCRACGREVYWRAPAHGCALCSADGLQAPSDWFASFPPAGERPRIACVMQLRNESVYLPGCLRHLRGHVDGVIALDDGSTDGTLDVLRSDPIVIEVIESPPSADHVWDEQDNKRRLLRCARQLGMDWVLVCDADERYETRFLRDLHAIAAAFPRGHLSCMAVRCRELWDDPNRYRVDGLWGTKARIRFVSLPETTEFQHDRALHGQWTPDELREQAMVHRLDYNLYHAKTIRQIDRIKRRDFYVSLDPTNRFQSIGYRYLAEEGMELRTEHIPAGKDYDVSTLPDCCIHEHGVGPSASSTAVMPG